MRKKKDYINEQTNQTEKTKKKKGEIQLSISEIKEVTWCGLYNHE